jgi:hypothetical protein
MAFYGPNYTVNWKGQGNGFFRGSVIVNSFSVAGGGGGSFYYDEALKNLTGFTVDNYTVSSYFEDTNL